MQVFLQSKSKFDFEVLSITQYGTIFLEIYFFEVVFIGLFPSKSLFNRFDNDNQ